MRRSFRWWIALLVWVVAAAAPVQAASPGITVAADGTTTATGTLQVVHADDFAHESAKFWYSLRTTSSTLRLDFPITGPMDDGGATVQVTGRMSDGVLHVATDAPSRGLRILKRATPLYSEGGVTYHHDAQGNHVPDAPVAAAGGTAAALPDPDAPKTAVAATPTGVSIAVILLNFSNDTSQNVSPTTANNIVFAGTNSVANFFEEESRDAIAITGHVYGWYTIPATNAGCDWPNWGSQAAAAAQAAGVDVGSFDHVVFAWPNASSCGWAGLGYMPGPYSYNNGSFNLRVIAHELSHNFGTNHASSLTCTSGATVVALSATCSYSEYGDPFTVMGAANTYHNGAEQLGELGWLRAGELATVLPGGTWTIRPVLTSPSGSLKVLQVARGDGTSFFLDVRATYGPYFDTFGAGSPAVTGVMIRLSPDSAIPTWGPQNTKLIDTTPGTSTFTDAPLAVGQMLTDPVSHISITTVSLDASGATVQITESVPPSTPGALGSTAHGPHILDLAWTASTDNAAVTGYTVKRDGVDIANLGASAVGYQDTGLTSETAYHYEVTARDGSGNSSAPATLDVTTPPDDPNPPTAPTGLAQSGATATTVSLAWTAGTDDQGIAGYEIWRNGVHVTTVTGTSWTDTSRTPNTSYTYAVVTVDWAANVSPAAETSAATTPDLTAPTKPAGFKIGTYHTAWTSLTWKPSTDNVKVVGYKVYRVGRTAPILTTTKRTVHLHRVKGVRYYVRAYDAAGHVSWKTPSLRST